MTEPLDRLNKRRAALAISLFVLALTLRLINLDQKSLWLDEASCVVNAWRSFPEMLQDISVQSSNPPLYFILLKLWIKAIDGCEKTVRSLSIIFDMALIGIAYRIAKVLFDGRTALIALALLAISPYQIYYAQEARMYALLGALSMASTFFLLRLWRGEKQGPNLAAYAISSALLLYTHYFGVGTIAAHSFFSLYQALRGGRKRLLLMQASGALLAFLCFLPWLDIALRQVIVQDRDLHRTANYGQVLEDVAFALKRFATGFSNPTSAEESFYSSLLAFVLCLPAIARPALRDETVFCILLAVVPFLVTVATDFLIILYIPKYLTTVFPMAALLLARALRLDNKRLVVLLPMILAGQAYFLLSYYRAEDKTALLLNLKTEVADYRRISRYILDLLRERPDLKISVITDPDFMEFCTRYYLSLYTGEKGKRDTKSLSVGYYLRRDPVAWALEQESQLILLIHDRLVRQSDENLKRVMAGLKAKYKPAKKVLFPPYHDVHILEAKP